MKTSTFDSLGDLLSVVHFGIVKDYSIASIFTVKISYVVGDIGGFD